MKMDMLKHLISSYKYMDKLEQNKIKLPLSHNAFLFKKSIG